MAIAKEDTGSQRLLGKNDSFDSVANPLVSTHTLVDSSTTIYILVTLVKLNGL